jgi:hypothetical protein
MIKCWKKQGRISRNEENLSTKEPTEEKGPRFQKKDVHRRRKKGLSFAKEKREKKAFCIGRDSGLLFYLL